MRVCDRSQKTTGFSHRDLHGVCDRRQQPTVASLAENVAVASAGHEVQQLSAFTVPNAERPLLLLFLDLNAELSPERYWREP